MHGEHLARWFEPPDAKGKHSCRLCPRRCRLGAGQPGFCSVRQVHGDRPVTLAYGRPTGFGVDPIEKKPLNQFFPATDILSFGTVGCNLGCKFCQNWSSSKAKAAGGGQIVSPEDVVALARRRGCPSIAFTYNDPVVFAEYAIDVAQLAHAQGLYTVAVTAGYIEPEPREQLFAHIDAANVDLKSMDDGFYRKLSAARLGPVLETLAYLAQETDVWVELTNLVIPGLNDDDRDFEALAAWTVEHMGPDTPLHFSAFHPDYRLTQLPRTPIEALTRARHIASSHGLRYVYTGNVMDPASQSTSCPSCGALVIGRRWYQVGPYDLDDRGRCTSCGSQVAGRFGPHAGAVAPRPRSR